MADVGERVRVPADEVPEVLWRPDPDLLRRARITAFADWLRDTREVSTEDYGALYTWSVHDLAGFWSAIAEFFEVRFHDAPVEVLADARMPGARWFAGATLNYAEHALADGPGRADDDLAVIFAREDGTGARLTFADLRAQVAAARAGLIRLGVRPGDRVVALVPNCPQAMVAFLAAASLGAVWSSCSPDFGLRAAQERFAQIEPAVLVAVDGYTYGGKPFDVLPTVSSLRERIPSLRGTVLIPYRSATAALPDTPHPAVTWDHLLREHADAPLEFTAVPFDHPLWVLYSSGTTGLPKGIVHGHGGILLEHLKSLALHADVRPGDRFFWFTTTGWMMWNFLVSGLLVGATVVLYDGSPAHPDLGALWRLAQTAGVTYFGTSAPYLQSCLKQGLRPRESCDLSAVRSLGSTGSPLTVDGFRWIGEAVGRHVQICSVSGGTDVCSAVVGAAPNVPVWLGEISCRILGAAVEAYDEAGRPVVGQVGELVLTRPMPSMPVAFWDDPDGAKLAAAYFEMYPGNWRHGDWIKVTPRGSCVIYGRSDSTLNRGGVRMGTAEFYRVVEGFDEVADSLVVDTTSLSGRGVTGELLCFVVLAAGASLADVEPKLRAALAAELSPRHVPNRFVVVDDVPRTLNGKKCEVPVKRILAGTDPDRAVSRDALRNPDALAPYIALARRS